MPSQVGSRSEGLSTAASAMPSPLSRRQNLKKVGPPHSSQRGGEFPSSPTVPVAASRSQSGWGWVSEHSSLTFKRPLIGTEFYLFWMEAELWLREFLRLPSSGSLCHSFPASELSSSCWLKRAILIFQILLPTSWGHRRTQLPPSSNCSWPCRCHQGTQAWRTSLSPE